MLVLVVGDSHIPYKASGVPAPLKKLLIPGKIQQVITVGNINDPETRQLLKRVTPHKPIISVPGSEDPIANDAKTSQVITIGKVRVGVVSSFEIIPQDDTDSLASKARQLDVQILLWGSYHQDTQEWDGKYFITPGSLTGVASTAAIAEGDTTTDAGFCLLEVTDNTCIVFVYKLLGDSVNVEKAELALN